MFKINDNYLKLPGSYLFSTIAKKVAAYTQANPEQSIIRLGIGDVTQPLAPAIIDALQSQKMTMSKEAATSQRTRFLFQMVQNAIPEIFRRFSVKTIKLQYVIRFTLCMWIRMSWQGAPECMMQRQRCGAM